MTAESGSGTIGFRLDPEARGAFEARASAFEISPGMLAKMYVLEALMASEERQQLRERVSALEADVAELRKEFAHAVQVLLVSAGKVQPEYAEAWVAENFNRK